MLSLYQPDWWVSDQSDCISSYLDLHAHGVDPVPQTVGCVTVQPTNVWQ